MKNHLTIIAFILCSFACNKDSRDNLPKLIEGKWVIQKIYTPEIKICDDCNKTYIFELCEEPNIYQQCNAQFINASTSNNLTYRLSKNHDSLWINNYPYLIYSFNPKSMTLNDYMNESFIDLNKVN